ncbi:META domain-containing protein [Kribbella sindirgiensis]|nr:META domain-containing protein [Kribbella sindirgiensis]
MTVVYGPLIGGEGSPIGKTYLSVSVQDDGVERAVVPGTRIRVQIRKDGVLIARAGCNSLSGGIMLDDGVLRFDSSEIIEDGVLRFASGPIQTQMNCGPEFSTQDDWFFGFLVHEPEWTVDGDTFTLTNGRTTFVLLDIRLAEPDPPLDGTLWTVEAILRDTGHFGYYGSAVPATLVLNGTLASGSTGSSAYAATVARADDTLTFTHLSITPTNPSGRAAAMEQDFLEALRVPLTYTMKSNRLRLRAATGTGGVNLVADRPDGYPPRRLWTQQS